MDNTPNRLDTVEIRGLRLKVLRRKARLTQARLANQAGVSRGYIAVIEGETHYTVSKVTSERLADSLRTSVGELTIADETEVDLAEKRPPTGRPRRGINFRGGVPVPPQSQSELLGELLHHLEVATEIVRELLSSDEEAK